MALGVGACSPPTKPQDDTTAQVESTASLEVDEWMDRSEDERLAVLSEVVRRLPNGRWTAKLTPGLKGQKAPVAVVLDGRTGIEFVLVPGGALTVDDDGGGRVLAAAPLLMARREVTNRQFAGYRRDPVPEHALDLPAAVQWIEARRYCDEMDYELPLPYEWEFACRAMSTEAFSFGRPNRVTLSRYAWWNVGGKIHAGGGKLPNAFGLFDMHGNVSEWGARHPEWEGRAYVHGGSGHSVHPQELECGVRKHEWTHEVYASIGLRPIVRLESK